MALWLCLKIMVIWLKGRVQFIGQGVEGWMAKMQWLAKAYEGLGCPKGKHMDYATLEPIRGWHMSQVDLMKGRARWIVIKGVSRDKGFINTHKCFEGAFNAFVRAINAWGWGWGWDCWLFLV